MDMTAGGAGGGACVSALGRSSLSRDVINGAVIAPEFGDPQADKAAFALLSALYPQRKVVQLEIDAIAAGGSTLRDFANAEGGQGYFQHRFDVYGREGEPCRGDDCAGLVARIVQGGRSTFFCPSCQKR